jgi:hypothetical protein
MAQFELKDPLELSLRTWIDDILKVVYLKINGNLKGGLKKFEDLPRLGGRLISLSDDSNLSTEILLRLNPKSRTVDWVINIDSNADKEKVVRKTFKWSVLAGAQIKWVLDNTSSL